MALALSMRVGHKLHIGDAVMELTHIDNPRKFRVSVNGGIEHWVTDTDWSSVMPGVWLKVGYTKAQGSSSVVRVAINAPGIPIVRAGLLGKVGNKACGVCDTCHGSGKLKVRERCSSCHGFGCAHCKGTGVVTSEFKCPDCAGK